MSLRHPEIANAIHIVVTFNFRFCAHNGLKSDIALRSNYL
jgi:hypothetical protein